MQPLTSTYCRPALLEEALDRVSQPGSVVLCGGTDFFPDRLRRRTTEAIVDVSAVHEMRGITRDVTAWRIGAATTWREIARCPMPGAFDGLRAAARQVGGVQIQWAGTIGGNLCTASPAGDGVPPLLALGASVELRSRCTQRTMPLGEFITGYRRTALKPGELLTAITVPDDEPSTVGSFVKLGSRAYLVISIAMAAAVVTFEDGVIGDARVAIGACSPVAQRLPGVEAALRGAPCRPDAVAAAIHRAPLAELEPIDDVRAPARYRRDVAPQLLIDAVLACGAAA